MKSMRMWLLIALSIACGSAAAADPVGPTGYKYCSAENAYCIVDQTRSVAYGAAGSFQYRVVSGGATCSNAVFSDPAPGVPKSCFAEIDVPANGPAGYQFCAEEGQTCPVAGPSLVAYGSGSNFNYASFSADIYCSNAIFGDPNPNVVKACYSVYTSPNPPANFTLCSAESATCTVSAPTSIAFGAYGKFAYQTLSGTFSCSTALFGDPQPGFVKSCYKVG